MHKTLSFDLAKIQAPYFSLWHDELKCNLPQKLGVFQRLSQKGLEVSERKATRDSKHALDTYIETGFG